MNKVKKLNVRIGVEDYRYGFSDPEVSILKSQPGLSSTVVKRISAWKKETSWMTDFRLRSLEIFFQKKMPMWGADLSGINFDSIHYYVRPTDQPVRNWEEVPSSIKETFDRIGVPKAEQKFLSGVTAQYDSESVYHSLQETLKKKGVIFLDMDSGLREHPEIVKRYFGTVIPPQDNKFAALNSAAWSGGSFVYVPKGVRVDIPLQAYFRINAKNMGQFERTLIIAEEGSFVHYVEGCSAPVYTTDSLHAAVVEIIVKKGARVRYTTIQNWSGNVYNLVTKRARVEEEGAMEWIDCNIGSKATMKYPSVFLMGPKAHGEILSLAVATAGQVQDAGGKMIHAAPLTSSRILSKSISKNGGRTSFRGLVKIYPGARQSKSHVRCDALILDERSRSDTYPTMNIEESDVSVGHEAVVSKLGEDQLFYLTSRGISEQDAVGMIVNGFIEPVVKELPLEYAIEMNRLIQLEMDGGVG